MDDLISRQATIDAVQEELTKWEHAQLFNIWTTAEVRFLMVEVILKQIPSAQPEIIRCKDCRHNGSFDTDCPIDWKGKEYCSFAER